AEDLLALDALEAADGAEAGVVDEDPDLEVRDPRLDPLDRALPIEVDRNDARLHTVGAPELRRERLQPVRPARDQDEIHLLGGELRGERRSDPRRGPRDECPFSVRT